MKKIYSISMIKDEADIIEAFIRHNETVIDTFFILDNGSTDNTLVIIRHLINEGKKIVLWNDSDTEYNQMQKTNELFRRVLREYPKADFIIPLDADEFLVSDCDKSIKDVFDYLPSDRLHFAYWANFVPTQESHLQRSFVPFKMDTVRVAEKEQKKIIIPVNLVYDDTSFLIKNGSHDFFSDNAYNKQLINDIKFAHFPIRSIEQYLCKIVLGYTNRIVSTSYTKGISTHIENAFYDLKRGSIPSLSVLKDEAAYYCLYDSNQRISLETKKFNASSFDLKYEELIVSSPITRILERLESLGNELRQFRLKAPVTQANDDSESITREINSISFRKVREERLKYLRANSYLKVYQAYIALQQKGISFSKSLKNKGYTKVYLYGEQSILSLIMNEEKDFFDIISEYSNINDAPFISEENSKSIIAILDDSRIQEHESRLNCYQTETVSLFSLIEAILQKEV